jgi:hypothetical protein
MRGCAPVENGIEPRCHVDDPELPREVRESVSAVSIPITAKASGSTSSGWKFGADITYRSPNGNRV